MNLEPWKWTEEDLLELISSEVQESLELDYKRCEALQKSEGKKNELSKDVSAFANAAGGIIVYGIKEDGHFPIGIDEGLDPEEISKEWIEQVINSKIHRRISGILVNQVQLKTTAPGRVAYVIYIPQSSNAPHQAADKRFYKRFNFESTPMEEYEIRDVMNRATAPDLFATFCFKNRKESVQLEEFSEKLYSQVEIFLAIVNQSSKIAEYAVIDILIDQRIKWRPEKLSPDVRVNKQPSTLSYEGIPVPLNRLVFLWDAKKGMPLFSGIEAEIPTPALELFLPRNEPMLALGVTIGSPGMKTRHEYTFISIKDNVAEFIIPVKKEIDSL
ncbi:helix-turn-helix domain-containing protein [Variovorax sp. UC122_21]|uniref:AlbA family DNA-binding domain-containing protein n=1 Tax=Variovorax sp. UC122_21 TaxID=3374554 RepID=UPI0037577E2B